MKHFQKSQHLLNGVDAAKRDSEFEAELVYYLGTTARSLGKIVEAGNFLRQASEYFVGLKVYYPRFEVDHEGKQSLSQSGCELPIGIMFHCHRKLQHGVAPISRFAQGAFPSTPF